MNTIDVKDLCIGSYIGCGDQVHRVVGLHGNKMVRIAGADKYGLLVWVIDYHSIEITPEWLEKLGGVREDTVYHGGSKDVFLFCKSESNGTYRIEVTLTPAEYPCVVINNGEYDLLGIHHLQALVWQLERVWLEIKPSAPTNPS